MGSRTGITKIAAERTGVSIDEYKKRLANGEKWCTGHKRWESNKLFSKDSARGDGLDKECKEAKSLKSRKLKLKHRYGMSPEDEIAILEAQNYTCAICGNKLDGRYDIDHNHLTLTVRGILCHSCNALLGYAKENIDILFSAINYLEANNGKNKN